jgi:hypothetical protein
MWGQTGLPTCPRLHILGNAPTLGDLTLNQKYCLRDRDVFSVCFFNFLKEKVMQQFLEDHPKFSPNCNKVVTYFWGQSKSGSNFSKIKIPLVFWEIFLSKNQASLTIFQCCFSFVTVLPKFVTKKNTCCF